MLKDDHRSNGCDPTTRLHEPSNGGPAGLATCSSHPDPAADSSGRSTNQLFLEPRHGAEESNPKCGAFLRHASGRPSGVNAHRDSRPPIGPVTRAFALGTSLREDLSLSHSNGACPPHERVASPPVGPSFARRETRNPATRASEKNHSHGRAEDVLFRVVRWCRAELKATARLSAQEDTFVPAASTRPATRRRRSGTTWWTGREAEWVAACWLPTGTPCSPTGAACSITSPSPMSPTRWSAWAASAPRLDPAARGRRRR